MHRVRRHTVLERGTCKLDGQALTHDQSFVLMLFDGRRTVAEVASIQGMTLPELFPHVDHLLGIGALTVVVEDVSPNAARASSSHPPVEPPAPEASEITSAAKTIPPPKEGRRTGRNARITQPIRAARITTPRRTTPPPERGASTPSRPVSREPREPVESEGGAHRRTPHRRPRSTASVEVSGRITPATPARPSTGRRTTGRKRPTVEPPRETDELDEAAIMARILAFDAKLATSNHYELLGIERTADRATLKRAYFALAAEFHPDRHFDIAFDGATAALKRVFGRLTVAHDTLSSAPRRAEYDAGLDQSLDQTLDQSLTEKQPAASAMSARSANPARRTTQRAKAYTGKPATDGASAAPAEGSGPPDGVGVTARPPAASGASGASVASRGSATAQPPVMRSEAPTISVAPTGRSGVSGVPGAPGSFPPGSTSPPVSGTRSTTLRGTTARPGSSEPIRHEDFALFRFYTSAKREEVTRRVAIFLQAATEAVRRNDPIAAAENYRLALQIHEDPVVRAKLNAIEGACEEAQQRRAARAKAREGQ